MKTYTNEMRIALMDTMENYRRTIRALQQDKEIESVLRHWSKFGSFYNCKMCVASGGKGSAPNCHNCPLSEAQNRSVIPCLDNTYRSLSKLLCSGSQNRDAPLEAFTQRFIWLIDKGVRTGIL